jgi:ABC-2 type transport system ATP-binding protein
LEGVSKSYGGQRVLEEFSFELEPGCVTALLGPNGAGKSTVAGLLTGRLTTDTGRVSLFGLDPRDRRARARMGIMLQSAGLPETLTVKELIDLHASHYARRMATDRVIEQTGLVDLADRRCSKLSGGEQRRVQFALAISGAPDLLVLDEPTTGFDSEARRAMWQLVRSKAEAGTAVLLATHHMDEAEALADRIVVIAKGAIIADGPPPQIKAQVAGSVLRLRTRQPAARFRNLPDVVKVEERGADLAILTSSPRPTLEAVFQIDPDLQHFEVVGASLEDALENLIMNQSEKEAA